ncbi:hypothetical protein T4C_12737 [Trichinella pseudospiralis]|uniref:Uncharacterized protein n=1 Tax=Trichinella pseudospiralis TaxID=6337 RepID=A0A0V1GAJ9_TRIPS|nr:hypothetical protein T4C_12737 [Trichinella pseudospiralis]
MTVLLNPSRMKCCGTQLSYNRLVVGTAVMKCAWTQLSYDRLVVGTAV